MQTYYIAKNGVNLIIFEILTFSVLYGRAIAWAAFRFNALLALAILIRSLSPGALKYDL